MDLKVIEMQTMIQEFVMKEQQWNEERSVLCAEIQEMRQELMQKEERQPKQFIDTLRIEDEIQADDSVLVAAGSTESQVSSPRPDGSTLNATRRSNALSIVDSMVGHL